MCVCICTTIAINLMVPLIFPQPGPRATTSGPGLRLRPQTNPPRRYLAHVRARRGLFIQWRRWLGSRLWMAPAPTEEDGKPLHRVRMRYYGEFSYADVRSLYPTATYTCSARSVEAVADFLQALSLQPDHHNHHFLFDQAQVFSFVVRIRITAIARGQELQPVHGHQASSQHMDTSQ